MPSTTRRRILSMAGVGLLSATVAAAQAELPPASHFDCRPGLGQGSVAEVLHHRTTDEATLAEVQQARRVWMPPVRPSLIDHAPVVAVVDLRREDASPPRLFAVEQGGYGGAVVRVFGPLPDCLTEARTPRTPAVQAAAR